MDQANTQSQKFPRNFSKRPAVPIMGRSYCVSSIGLLEIQIEIFLVALYALLDIADKYFLKA